MPMALKDIPRFERMNNISVSVYGYNEGQEDEEKEKGFVYPLLVAQELKERHVNLLLISNENTSHYCLIKNFSHLVRSQVTSKKCAHFFCRFYIHGFTRQDLLDAHEGECYVHGAS